MTTPLATAFLLGLVGSLHCVGMCGPLALMLPAATGARWRYIGGRLLYNVGRILTYGFLGLLIGFVGEQFAVFFSQKWLSGILGAIILIILFLPKATQQRLELYAPLARLTRRVKSGLAALFKQNHFFANFLFGLVNGLLPCGLVYAALAGAFLQSSGWDGGLYMLIFGLGTWPMMLAITLGAGWLKQLLGGGRVQRLIPITYGLVALWLILRGFNVGLPNLYTAPDVNNIPECHTPTSQTPLKK